MGVIIHRDVFGKIFKNGRVEEINRFTLTNGSIVIQLITYGATITSIKVADKNGNIEDIVLGFDDIESYLKHTHYFGATIGRFANRIANGKFVLNNKKYSLALNNGPNHLHGGQKGFDKVIWDWKVENNKVVFSYKSPNMEENYPGDLKCQTSYELTEKNELIIEYEAKTNHMTPVNLTNHSYFNLSGHGNELIHDHVISINADTYTPVDENLIPLGTKEDVEATCFDLRQPKHLGSLISESETIKNGFDHNFCINGQEGIEREVARVYHPKSGRQMKVYSTQPGVQFYTGNCLPEEDTLIGKSGKYYRRHGALCLETQNYPDAVNNPNFPTAILQEGETYKHKTRYCFSSD